MNIPPHTNTHTHRHTLTLNPVVKSQPKIESRGSDGAVISLKIHSCKILLFKPPSPLLNRLIHLSLDCKTKHALSSAFWQEHLCPCTCERVLVCVCVFSLLLHKRNVLGLSDLCAPTEPPVKHLGRALPSCSSQSGALAANDIS